MSNNPNNPEKEQSSKKYFFLLGGLAVTLIGYFLFKKFSTLKKEKEENLLIDAKKVFEKKMLDENRTEKKFKTNPKKRSKIPKIKSTPKIEQQNELKKPFTRSHNSQPKLTHSKSGADLGFFHIKKFNTTFELRINNTKNVTLVIFPFKDPTLGKLEPQKIKMKLSDDKWTANLQSSKGQYAFRYETEGDQLNEVEKEQYIDIDKPIDLDEDSNLCNVLNINSNSLVQSSFVLENEEKEETRNKEQEQQVDGNDQSRAVEIAFSSPEHCSVSISASFNGWKLEPLIYQNGIWKKEFFLAPGTYHYRFNVDNEWKVDYEKEIELLEDDICNLLLVK